MTVRCFDVYRFRGSVIYKLQNIGKPVMLVISGIPAMPGCR